MTPQEIEIKQTPPNIIITELEIEQGLCHRNSYRVAKKNQNIQIVEGLIIMIDKENGAKAMPHVWNKTGELHFDVTRDNVWAGRDEMKGTKEIKYFPLKVYSSEAFKNGDVFEFSEETKEDVAAIAEIISKKGD